MSTACGIAGVEVFTPSVQRDLRGEFCAWYDTSVLCDRIGQAPVMMEGTFSVSRPDVIRGIHYTAVPPGRGKYVTCVSGVIFDVTVDLRAGSPTFGQHDARQLDFMNRQAVYIPEGVGHAFLSLSESVVAYLYTSDYDPTVYREVSALDPALGIGWPLDGEPVMSAKDIAAPSLQEALAAGLLPTWEDCQ
jgi:dTDP-4-dehydrorhamnose 3,5-epimerase